MYIFYIARQYLLLSLFFFLHGITFGTTVCFSNYISIESLKPLSIEDNQSTFLTPKIHQSIFIDSSIKNLSIEEQFVSSNTVLQLFTHGKSGQLLVENEWLNAVEIADWLQDNDYLVGTTHLNIYGCNFGKGEKGQAAVEYLESALNISIAASNDITGIEGDWDLEVGTPIASLSFPDYQGNLQGYIDCATILADDDDYNLSNNNNNPVRIIDGYTYVATHTTGHGTQQLPVINGEPYHNASGNNDYDSYIAVFDPACNQLLGTYVGGGNNDDIITTLEVDANGDIIVAGYTRSTDFSTTDGSVIVGTYATFVRKYALDGTLLFSTIIPTATFDFPTVIVDGTDYYILGENTSATFPTTDGTTLGSTQNGYVAKYDGNNNLIYLTQTGATGTSGENFDGVVTNGCLYVLGQSNGSFPTTDGTTVSGSRDAVFMKYDAVGNLVFSTVFGGEGVEIQFYRDIITDGNAIYIASSTTSDDFPTTDGSVPQGGFRDAYLRKYDLNGNLIFSKLFAVDIFPTSFYDLQYVNNAIYLMLQTTEGLPVIGGMTNAGDVDAYLVKLDTAGNTLFSTYYGASGTDQPSNFYVNAIGEIYFLTQSTNAFTTDGTSGSGTAIVKLNADGSLCAASHLNDNPFNFLTERFNVIGDTVYIVNAVADFFGGDNYSTDGSTMFPTDGYDLQLTKFVFCPDPTPIASDNLTPSTQTVCQNGLVDQILGEEQVIDGSTFPQLFDQGAPLNQADIELKYQWQVSTSAGGLWTDISGPVAQQKNYTPPPTTIDQYYRRLTKTTECCGGAILSTSTVSAVLVNGNTAPTVDAGGTFYTCPSHPVMLDATVTGGTPSYTYDWNDGEFTVEDPIVSPAESGVYTLIVTDANGCMQADQATVVTYAAEAGEASSVCAGVGTTIGGTPLAGVPVVAAGDTPPAGVYSIEYAWSPATALSCTDCPNPTASPLADETYTLTVTINAPDGSNCSTMDMVTVPVYSAPSNADFAGRDTVLCLGEMVNLGETAEPGVTVDFSGGSVTQSSVDGGTATIANLTDNNFSTGGHTADNANITLDLGSIQTINTIQIAALDGFTNDDGMYTEVSTDNVNFTIVASNFSGYSSTSLSTISIPTQEVRYIRFRSRFSSRDVSISELRVSLEYVYSWTPGQYISTNGSMAIFDAGNLEMPTNNPITYTVNANIGTCNFYDQVTVAVIEARADEDYCGPRTVGEPDRTPNIEETYSWVKISDPGITTGTGDFLGAMDEAIVPVSASTGGDVGYELTVSYTLPSDVTGMCKDTVIVPPTCGPGCNIETVDGGCPDFDDGNPALTGIPPNSDDPNNWTYSWTSNEGMVGLDSYNTQTVNLTDNVTRRYYITFTSVIDPTFTCVDSIDANSASYSVPSYTAVTPVTSCPGIAVNIGDPANNPGLTYAWSNGQFLNDATISYPEATVNASTAFRVTVTDNVTGCLVVDTVQVNVPDAANAGPDLVVCDNGTVTIGGSAAQAGYTYSWSPAGADWRNGTDENDAQPDVFVATTQIFTLTLTDPSGMCVSMDDAEVIVEPLPPSFTLPDLSFCPSQADDLVLGTDDGTTTGTNQVPTGFTYAWTPALVSDGTAINPTVNTPLPSTTTTYEVIVSNTNGCNQRANQTIIPITDAPLVATNQTICIGESIFIGDTANPTGGGETYSWNPTTDLSDPTLPNPEYSPSVAGTTTFILTKTVGGCSATADVTITTNEATAPMLTPQTICEGAITQIGVIDDPSLQYDWFPTTGLDNAFISNPTFSGTTSTNYTLTIIDGNGCTAETFTSVTVNPAPAITITLPDTTICDANATSIVINAGVAPAGSYAYQWSPTTNLSNPNALNPEFFIPGEGDYIYTLEVIDQSTGCSIFGSTTMSVRTYNIPEVTAFAIQPSCVDNVAQSDGYLQISEATFGDRYHWSMGSTFDDNGGAKTFANATSLLGATYPVQFNTGLSNANAGTYTIRVYSGAADCFTDVVVTMNEQDCTTGCSCTEMIYLNETSDGGKVHKFTIAADGSLSEITNSGNAWYPGAGVSEISSPHGVGLDLNGRVYIGGFFEREYRQLTCDGEITDRNDFLIEGYAFNLGTIDNKMYVNSIRFDGSIGAGFHISQYDLCTQSLTDSLLLNVANDNGGNATDWGFFVDNRTGFMYSTNGQNGDHTLSEVFRYTEADFAADVPIDPFIPSGDNVVNVGDNEIPHGNLRGITTDNNGNIYIVMLNDGDASTSVRSSRLLKYDANGNFLAGTPWETDDTELNGTFFGLGIIYSETSNTLFLSRGEPALNCVQEFDLNLNDLGVAVGPASGTGTAKGIGLTKECCPTNNNLTIDTALCTASLNDKFFLQEIINCDGTICEGIWQEGMSNTGLNYESCDNSITITALNACGTFTLESDGTGNNPQCGAFKITVNIKLENVSEPAITAGTAPACANSNDPGAITISTPASGSSTVSYRWQSSTTDCITGFTDIAGAPTDGTAYDPPAITQETYYRVIAEVNDMTCVSGVCADTSNCVTLTPESGCCTNPTATAFAIQPSCTNGVPQSDGYLQLSAVMDGDRVNFSTGNTYSGDTDYANATAIGALPFQFNTGLSNPSGSQDYTIRVFNGASDCFTDVVVTMNEQDCTIGCECEDFLYAGDISTGVGRLEKIRVNNDGSLTVIDPNWLTGIFDPHGIGMDNNGFIYSMDKQGGDNIWKMDCEGTVLEMGLFAGEVNGTNNIVVDGNNLYTNKGIRVYDICSETMIGEALVSSSNNNWDVYQWTDDNIYTIQGGNFSQNAIIQIPPDPAVINSTNDFSIPHVVFDGNAVPSGDPVGATNGWRGITLDEFGNYYLMNSNGGTSTIYMVSPTGQVLATLQDAVDDPGTAANTGFYGGWGLRYSQVSGKLYASSRDEACIATISIDRTAGSESLIFEPTLSLPGGGSKPINILSQCCPTNNNITIDTTLCNGSVNDTIFLQELINCSGTICEGMWEEGMSNSGLTYNSCNNSVSIDALNSCGTFTLASDGTGNNPQCGAFTITVNIEVENITAPVIAGDQTICSGGDPAAFTVTTAATGSQTINYQWQNSTTDCTTGFSNIAGATAETYNPPALTETTYYRVISSVNGNCSSGMCADTSNCVTVTVIDPITASIAQQDCNDNNTGGVSTDDYLTLTVSASSTNAGASNQYQVVYNTEVLATNTYGTDSTIEYADALNTQRFAADGATTYTLTIRDVDDNSCVQTITTTPENSCSVCPPTICLPVQFNVKGGSGQ